MAQIFLGKNELKSNQNQVKGDVVTLQDEKYYKISNYNEMHPFFISVVSESDLWMYISSNGALTAGRRNADNALFPYYTDDRIHDSQEITGNKTILLISKNDKTYIWEPFSSKYKNIYQCESNLYKNLLGNKIIFEENNIDLGISFQYSWNNCDQFCFVKKAQLINHNTEDVKIQLLDGIQNLLPSGIDRKFQLEYSTLVDGYKKNELIPEVNLGLYMLSSVPVDRAEPSESLTATIAWSAGLGNVKVLLSSVQLDAFRNGESVDQEVDVRAERGAYFINTDFTLEKDQSKSWYQIIDLNKNQSEVAALADLIENSNDLPHLLQNSIDESSKGLIQKIAKADGSQLTNDTLNVFRHSANTVFNIMRGGIFDDNYLIDCDDFKSFLATANKKVAEKYTSILDGKPETIPFQQLIELAKEGDQNFKRLCNEYLPLSFSRRHGDPSRPWNMFSIDIKDEQGNKTLNYQGNWRDIFQNWEALAFSFPEYIESMITKFVNASTADGYNPYRVVREGFDWEVIDPDDSWSYIGYWGDHQIIYLQKLLEISKKYHPGKLQKLLKNRIFTYANVPYKIKNYEAILKDFYNTVDFDYDQQETIEKLVDEMGTDGKFVIGSDGQIFNVNLAEKLLVPALVKLSNFIPEAGIWMNTQRPEWNDANNALVGNGTSMVTLYYLRRFVNFTVEMFSEFPEENFEVSEEVYQLFSSLAETFKVHKNLLSGPISDENRKVIVDRLSTAGSNHRISIYENGFSGKSNQVSAAELIDFYKITLNYIDHSIAANQRDDNLFHAYNLISIKEDAISIRYLYEMLEGQVSVLSSSYLSTDEALNLLHSLKKSRLYREDQNSYILYPNRQLARFNEKNIIPSELVEKSEKLMEFIKNNDLDIVQQDVKGNVHFHSTFRNAAFLEKALLKKGVKQSERQDILNIYEEVFDHQSFTGRSGTFYKYEGLGSIYWHMVSKLLLAIQETFFNAVNTHASDEQIAELKKIYYDVRKGIGSHKNPKNYGAFPTDPYSHTPGNKGVQQPGMTGQVKEDILSRFGELGVFVKDGKISFHTELLDYNEFLDHNEEFMYYNVNGQKNKIKLSKGKLAFTIAQVPIIYKLNEKNKILVTYKNNDIKKIESHELNENLSAEIFNRTGNIMRIDVVIAKK